jgi:DNA-binding transcriptional regulator YiaG
MANLQTLLKEAMARISRKQIRLMVGNQKQQIAQLRRKIKILNARADQAEKAIRAVQAVAASAPMPQAEAEAAPKRRITGKRIRALRRKLGLTQTELATLAHVTTQAVYLWERRSGPIRLRDTTRKELAKLQGLGRRDAQAMLTAVPRARKPGRPPKASVRGGKSGRKPGRRATR